jgi:hypothetical protein
VLPSIAADTVNAEVEIARINAERDIEVAKIGARQDRDWNETRVEVAGIEAEAEVGAAEATAEVVAAVIDNAGDDEPPVDPVQIIAPEMVNNDVDEDAPPALEGGSEPPASESKPRGLGMW